MLRFQESFPNHNGNHELSFDYLKELYASHVAPVTMSKVALIHYDV